MCFIWCVLPCAVGARTSHPHTGSDGEDMQGAHCQSATTAWRRFGSSVLKRTDHDFSKAHSPPLPHVISLLFVLIEFVITPFISLSLCAHRIGYWYRECGCCPCDGYSYKVETLFLISVICHLRSISCIHRDTTNDTFLYNELSWLVA